MSLMIFHSYMIWKFLPRVPQNNHKGIKNQGNCFFDVTKVESWWHSERKSLWEWQKETSIHQQRRCDATYIFHKGSVSNSTNIRTWRKGCGMFWHAWSVPTHWDRRICNHGTWRALGRDNGQVWPDIVQVTCHKNLEGKANALCQDTQGIVWNATQRTTFLKNISKDLEDYGFETNEYDPCVANKTVNGSQMAVLWNVYDLQVSHKDEFISIDLRHNCKKYIKASKPVAARFRITLEWHSTTPRKENFKYQWYHILSI